MYELALRQFPRFLTMRLRQLLRARFARPTIVTLLTLLPGGWLSRGRPIVAWSDVTHAQTLEPRPVISARDASEALGQAARQFTQVTRARTSETALLEGGTMKVLIAGSGIGGLATALSLHAVGIEAELFEQAREIREVGRRHQHAATCRQGTRRTRPPAGAVSLAGYAKGQVKCASAMTTAIRIEGKPHRLVFRNWSVRRDKGNEGWRT
jgi:hypothetical protein